MAVDSFETSSSSRTFSTTLLLETTFKWYGGKMITVMVEAEVRPRRP